MTPDRSGRPRVALVATTYFKGSHADVCGTRLIEGYEWGGRVQRARVEVVSMYLEQLGDHQTEQPREDIGLGIAGRNGVTVYPTVAEALGCGQPGVAVDGVVIIGEHGDYELNEFGQQLYPRRRLFDSAVSTMIGAGRVVPIFVDKHLAWSFTDARAMYDTARRLGIPLLAGSTLPLAWRVPAGTEWPAGEPMDEAVLVGYGPTERYGIHVLEGLQAHVERRRSGETGVAAVQAVTGEAVAQAVADQTIPADPLGKAFHATGVGEHAIKQAGDSIRDIFLVDYVDGLRAALIMCPSSVLRTFGAACQGPGHEMACQIWLQSSSVHGHFIFLVRQIENMILSGTSPYPVERTLLTTGMLDAAMHSLHGGGVRRPTPELAISYQPALEVTDTGIAEQRPPTVSQ